MLDIQVTIEGDKVLIEGLDRLAGQGIPMAITRGLRRIGLGVFGASQDWLNGAGGAGKKVRTDYTGFQKKSGEKVMFRSYEGAGAYPVPVRTGFLKQSLDWLEPGASKTSNGLTFTAGSHEAVIYDSAEYANAIHEGKGSSAKFGPRRYLTDALDTFNRGSHIIAIIEEEILKELPK